MAKQNLKTKPAAVPARAEPIATLFREVVAHLQEGRTQLRVEWVRRINEGELLKAMSPEEIFAEATSVYDNYVEVLESGSVEALEAYAQDLSERIIPRGVETHEVLGIVLLLRDVVVRSLFQKYQQDFDLLNHVLDAYEPAANRIANTVAVDFVQERERIIRQQQEAIRELGPAWLITASIPGLRFIVVRRWRRRSKDTRSRFTRKTCKSPCCCSGRANAATTTADW